MRWYWWVAIALAVVFFILPMLGIVIVGGAAVRSA